MSKQKDKKYKFVLVKDKSFPRFGSWWMCLIDNMMSACNVCEIKSKIFVETYWEMKKKKRPWHCTSGVEIGIETLFIIDRGHKTFIEDVYLISDMFITPILLHAVNGEKWLINSNWGMRPLNDSIEILSICERDKFVFPIQGEKDIKVTKWGGGKHYYAKIGNQDVVIDGKQKWNTEDKAREMALKYFKELEEVK